VYWVLPGVCRIVWSVHALRRMRERGVSFEEALSALRSPVEHVYDKSRDVYIAFDGSVAVVYAYRPPVIEVVTVMRSREYRCLIGRLSWRRYRVIQGAPLKGRE